MGLNPTHTCYHAGVSSPIATFGAHRSHGDGTLAVSFFVESVLYLSVRSWIIKSGTAATTTEHGARTSWSSYYLIIFIYIYIYSIYIAFIVG